MEESFKLPRKAQASLQYWNTGWVTTDFPPTTIIK